MYHEGRGPTGLLRRSASVSEAYSGVEPQGVATICQQGLWPEDTEDYSDNSKTGLVGTDFLFFVSFIESQIDDSTFDMENF